MRAYDDFVDALVLERFTPEPQFSERQLSAMHEVMDLLGELLSSEFESNCRRMVERRHLRVVA